MPPKRKAAAIDETDKTIKENQVLAFRYNTHYTTLYLDLSHRIPYTPEVFTYEGVKLCHSCLQVWEPKHNATSRLAGCRVPVPKFSKPCDDCKMPLRPGSHDKRNHLLTIGKDGTSACEVATGLGTTDDTWKPDPVFKSLICPGCKMPGFNVDSIRAHLRDKECVGRKEFIHMVRKTVAADNEITKCLRCEYWFSSRVFKVHVCGSDLDPIWLGKQQELPDISKPYLVWGHELPPPFGPTSFGGGYRRDGSQGAIPVEVLEKSWAAPFALSGRFCAESIQQEDLYNLIRAVNHLLADRVLVDALEESHSAQKYSRAWVANVSKKDISDKVQTMRTEFERLNRVKNELIFQHNGVTYSQVKGADKCPGFAWRHGSFDCRHGSSINLGTIGIRIVNERVSIQLVNFCCVYCHWDSSAINSWTRYSKFNGKGERLCTRPNCLEILETSLDCAKHVLDRRERTLSNRAKRLETKRKELEQGTAQANKFARARGAQLWKIVSRDDIGRFFSRVKDARLSSLSEDWRQVKSSLVSPDYNGPRIFYIDTESALIPDEESNSTLIPFEVAILDHLGNVVVNTTVDYNKSVADLMRGCSQHFIAKSCAMYGLKDASGKTRGMTPAQLRQKLRASGLDRDSILVEHSSSGWDQKALAEICGDDTPQKTLCTLQLFSSLQYRGPRDLQTMFLIAWPNSKLKSLHHRALWDACKMLMILRCLFNGGLTDEPETAEFFKECLAFKNWAHPRPSDADTALVDALDDEYESDADEEFEELDWGLSELDDAD